MSRASSDIRGVACKFTSIAERDLQLAKSYSMPQSALQIRDGVYQLDWTVFEVYSFLSKNGWELFTWPLGVPMSRAAAPDYVVGGPKQFWLKADAVALNRWYVLCLALADKHQQPVPHFKSAARYKAIIEGKTFDTKAKGTKIKFYFGPEGLDEELLEGEAVAPAESEGDEEEEEEEQTEGRKAKERRTEYEANEDVWGHGRVTFKMPGPNSKYGGWQGSCRYHRLNDRTACKKLFSIRSATPEANEFAMRSARHWINMAPTFGRKRDHGAFNPSAAEVPLASVVSAQKVSEVPDVVMTDVELDALESEPPNPPARPRKGKPSRASSSTDPA